jgi:hypothetical protein
VRGHVGLQSPYCVRCGAENPKRDGFTDDTWIQLLEVAPWLLRMPISIAERLEAEGVIDKERANTLIDHVHKTLAERKARRG